MAEPQIKLSYAGSVALPKRSTAPLEGSQQPVEVSELSGLIYLPKTNTIRAVGDKARSAEKDPLSGAKASGPQNLVFDFKLDTSSGKMTLHTPKALALDVQRYAVEQRDLAAAVAPGHFIPTHAWDAEDLIQLADGRMLVAVEGFDEKHKPGMAAFPRVGSGLAIVEPDGRISGMLPLPDEFRPVEGDGENAGKLVRGQRPNLGLEAAGLSEDGSVLLAGMEGALVQDGELSSFEKGSTVRILKFSQDDSGKFSHSPQQIKYPLEKIPLPENSPVLAAKCDNGLVDLLPLSSDRFLAMERATIFYEDGRVVNSVRIYDVRLKADGSVASKTEAFNSKALESEKEIVPSPLGTAQPGKLSPGGQRSENFEGICFGPKTETGEQTILMLSDDNARDNQRTILVMLKLKEETSSE